MDPTEMYRQIAAQHGLPATGAAECRFDAAFSAALRRGTAAEAYAAAVAAVRLWAARQ